MTLTPGDLGVDVSGYRLDTPAKIQTAKAAGCKFVLRYSAGVANTQPATAFKLITPAEFRALIAAGFDVIANSEWYETRITEGAAAGHADGVADLALWRSCGLNRGSSIYVSWDAAVLTSQINGVVAYLNAYQAALGGYYHADCYGGTPALQHLLSAAVIRYGWRPNAGSWSNDGLPYQPDTSSHASRAGLVAAAMRATPAHLWQTGNYWFSQQADENMIVRVPVGSHLENAPAPPVPPTPPTPAPPSQLTRGSNMLVVQDATTGATYLQADDRSLVHIPDPPDAYAYAAKLGGVTKVTHAFLSQFPGALAQAPAAAAVPDVPAPEAPAPEAPEAPEAPAPTQDGTQA